MQFSEGVLPGVGVREFRIMWLFVGAGQWGAWRGSDHRRALWLEGVVSPGLCPLSVTGEYVYKL